MFNKGNQLEILPDAENHPGNCLYLDLHVPKICYYRMNQWKENFFTFLASNNFKFYWIWQRYFLCKQSQSTDKKQV